MESIQTLLHFIFIKLLLFANTSNSILHSLEERTCSPSFVCSHGICNGLSCICDVGWKGDFCNISQCGNDCFDTETCMLLGNGTYSCVKRKNDSSNTTTDRSITSENTKRSFINETDSSKENACSADYQLKPERNCKILSFSCVYGVCKIVMKPTQMEIQCICDLGSYGGRCEKKCCKTCNEPYGQCRLDEMNQEYCICRSDFTGENCQFNRSRDENTEASSQSFFETTSASVSFSCSNDSWCTHGNCVSGKCVCNNGWAGIMCEKECPFACVTPKKCVYKDDKFLCQENDADNRKIAEINYNITTTVPQNYNSTNVCLGNYQLRPERICPHINFECMHGVCSVTRTPRQFEIDCKCDPGSYGGRCEKICCKQCNEPFGRCRLNGTGHEICECHHDYFGKHCQFKRPKEQPGDTKWTQWVIYGSVFVVFSLITMVTITLYCMWKHRVLMVMKLVHRFQPFEDGDDKDYDAFVSYRSSDADEQFVYNCLFPKLESEMGFKLCLHCRNFIPGETIANNIMWAINNSRRTILVLSPDYVKSEWTKFEYQFAQREMLKRKHRIIPIILADIPKKDYVDQNLRLIMESVTYLKWPENDNIKTINHFWKQLHLSMPKTKKTSQSSSIKEHSPDLTELTYKESRDLHVNKLSLDRVEQKSKRHEEERDSGSFHSFIDDDEEEKKEDIEVLDETINVGNLHAVLSVDVIDLARN